MIRENGWFYQPFRKPGENRVYIVKISPIGINGSHGLETKSLELKQTYKVKIKSSPLLYRGLDEYYGYFYTTCPD